MDLRADLAKLSKNKPAMVGLAGAAALGGYALYRRTRGGGAGVTGPTSALAGSGYMAGLDTSGANQADFLSQFSGTLGGQLGQLGDAITSLQGINGTGTGVNGKTATGVLSTPIWLHTQSNVDSPVGALLQPGQSAAVAGSAVTGGMFKSPQLGVSGNQWVPISVSGQTYYGFLPELAVS